MSAAGRPRVGAVVLAAGAGSRFGGPHGSKLLARLDGRPVLGHVLEALAGAGLDEPVVVVSPTLAATLAEAAWLPPTSRARQVVNPDPRDGLASSLRIGWAAALDEAPPPAAVVIALADQPRIPASLFARLVEAPLDPARPVVAARWSGDAGPNPVRLDVSAAALVAQATGDRGLGPLLARHPGLVRWIDVDGRNPDVDRPEDLAALATEPR